MLSIKSMVIGSVIIFVVYLLIISQAVKFADKMSKQTEENFANAVRIMQGEK
jgi:hypothetical protein